MKPFRPNVVVFLGVAAKFPHGISDFYYDQMEGTSRLIGDVLRKRHGDGAYCFAGVDQPQHMYECVAAIIKVWKQQLAKTES